MQDNSPDNKVHFNQNRNKLALVISDFFELFAKAIIIILILTCIFFRMCTVIGDSMNNTLVNGEKLIISNFLYAPKENDIIVFHETSSLNEPVVKRVIATGNKWVKIDFDNAVLYVSGDEIIDENDIVDETQYIYLDSGSYDQRGVFEVYVPEGYLFVMGDNRNNSTDSRSAQIGLVDVKTVLGKVLMRVGPASRIGIVK